jgi:hypothetical protein
MEKVIPEKRGLVIILVIATVFIFVGLVWGIATYLPLNILGLPSPSKTALAPVVGKNCVYPVSYWEKHPELYPAQLVIGGQVYKAKDIGKIFSDETQDTAVQLQAQLTGTYLNYLLGADQSFVETTIFEAYGWLVQHPIGSALTDSEREAGTRLFIILETYNQGLTGVASCEPGLPVTITETSTASETATIILTITPSETPTPIEFTATATYIIFLPTNTATRTTEPPIQIPSNTPVPPTEAPAPTNTPVPTTAPTEAPTNTPVTPATLTPVPTDVPTPTQVPN